MNHIKQRVPALMLLLAAISLGAWMFREPAAKAVFGDADAPLTVVIDPGHGGEDGGTSTSDGVTEAGINLEISLRLRDLLRFCGLRTSMIRETDTAVYTEGNNISQKKVSDLKHRVQMVNQTPNALLVSIHENFFEQSKYSGAQVFYAKTKGSEALAERTQESLRTALDPGNRRQCKPSASVYLMEHAECPAILVECGFLSNPPEAKRLQTATYQQKIAAAVTSAVTLHISESEDSDEIENCVYLQ